MNIIEDDFKPHKYALFCNCAEKNTVRAHVPEKDNKERQICKSKCNNVIMEMLPVTGVITDDRELCI